MCVFSFAFLLLEASDVWSGFVVSPMLEAGPKAAVCLHPSETMQNSSFAQLHYHSTILRTFRAVSAGPEHESFRGYGGSSNNWGCRRGIQSAQVVESHQEISPSMNLD